MAIGTMSVAFAILSEMDTSPLIARVVIDVPARALSEPFDYRVPTHLQADVTVGCPVAVPFGKRRCVGYVVSLGGTTAYGGELRDIDGVLGVPVFDGHAIGLAEWIASEYLAPLSEALRLFLPPGGAPRVVKTEHGWAYQGRQARAVSDSLVTRVEGAGFTPSTRATVQRAVLEALADGPVTVSELSADIPGAAAAVKALEAAGAVGVTERRRFRRPEGRVPEASLHTHTAEQTAAIDAITGAVGAAGGVVLLEGVTGSGKTEVYLSAIERVIEGGGSAIVLVPEISLTPQTVGRFRARLGDDVAVIHSRLSAGERFDQWQLALSGDVRVVVGARSALFAPLANVALVVIDEEHEPSYKQGQAPRYHAREVAERLCATRGAALVLGSATPSLESRYRADTRRYTRVGLTRRVGGGRPPEMAVVDMTAEFAAGNRSIYSRALHEALAGVAERSEKAVLFLNRRGFATFVLCRECGFVPECASCSVSLTYHEDTGSLECHHCGIRESLPTTCPRCGSAFLRKFGAGTERAESELARLFGELPIVRMDADTTSRKGGHEQALMRFEALKSGVLLGTQMIAKGLDYPDVTLVGVLNADTSMHVPDFRAGERTYQLLEQVSGRAGRGTKPGKVIIQTYWPDHPAVRAVAERDSGLLYVPESADREALGYPPYGRLANVLYSGAASDEVRTSAKAAAEAIRAVLPPGWEVLGPAAAPIARLKGKWRWHVLVKSPPTGDLPRLVGDALEGTPLHYGVTRVVDVDPLSML
ncbi:MAG: primosomal protein N' [Actinobacteria bacterium]|nr:primosomal protein N' [Actinomycetota bacterium]